MIFRKLLISASLVLSAVSAIAAPVEIETARGSVSLESNPESVAVLDIAAIDTISALGINISGIPNKLFVDYLDNVGKSAKVVGTLHEPDYKALSLLKPDMIIIGGRSSEAIKQVSKIAPSIDMTLSGDKLVEAVRERTLAYGELFDKQTEAETLLKSYDDAIESLNKATSEKGTGLVVMTNGPKVSAYGPGSRFGWIYELLGMKAATDGLKEATHGDAISFEFLLKTNPDWLLVIDRGDAIGADSATAKATLDNELVHKTTAWSKDQMVYLNSADVYIASGGIQAQLRILKQLNEAFGDKQ